VALVKRHGALVIAAKVVEILDLVDPNDPVLAGKGLLDGAELGALCRETRVTNTILGLSSGEQCVVVVVRHLVPGNVVSGCYGWLELDHLHQAVLHSFGGLTVYAVLASWGEEVALLDLIRPDTLSDPDHPEELVDVIARVA
jgi:hypothetical protein